MALDKLVARETMKTIVEEVEDTFAKQDGFYETFGYAKESGVAANLKNRDNSSVGAEYAYRTSGGTADIGTGTAEIKRLKGNSLVFNQLASGTSGDVFHINFQFNSNGSITVSGTATGNAYRTIASDIPVGHKVLMSISGNVYTTVQTRGTNELYSYIHTVVDDDYFRIRVDSGRTVNETVWVMVVDLTQMFGAGNEPTTVEEFRALFPQSYYAYNAGEIINFNGNGIKTIGFNAYNSASGTAKLLGGREYQITGTYTSVSYQAVSGFTETLIIDENGIFTPKNNGTLTVVGGGNDTCVHLVWSGVRNGEYEAYNENTLSFDILSIEDELGETLFADGLCKVGSVYDEITKDKAIKRIGKRAYASGDESDASVLTDKTTTLYVLTTPIEVDIDWSNRLTYAVDDFGTEEMLTSIASAPINYDVLYAMNAVDTLRRLPETYISKDSFDNFCSSLVTAMASIGYTMSITPSYNTETNEYDYSITLEEQGEEL